MKSMMKRMVVVGIIAILGWFGWMWREARIASSPQIAERSTPSVMSQHPQAAAPDAVSDTQDADDAADRPPTLVHRTVMLDVPFVSQAPLRIWSLPYKEFCEEASVLTLHSWKQGRVATPADQLDRDLKELQAWEEVNLGTWEDTNAEETARMLREYFGYASTKVVRNITPDHIKRALDAGTPIIVPARGREIDSPYFTPPGPLYHMLVIIGYDDDAGQWITNDVGTNTKGAAQRYEYDDLFDAIGDWDHGQRAPTNQKVMIVIE